jgi:uncharacterized protein (DUF1015 family)
MQINSFPVLLPPDPFASGIDDFCDAARTQLSQAFLPFKRPQPQNKGIVILEIISDNLTSVGIICLTNILDYQEKKLQVHEDTIGPKLKKQKEYLIKQGTFVKPILAGIEDHVDLTSWLQINRQKPIFKTFHSLKRQQIFNLWLVDDEDSILEVKEIFRNKITRAIIADGHHRSAACKSLFEEGNTQFSHLLTAYFPFSQLKILTFHRIYSLHKQTDVNLVLSSCSLHFELTKLKGPLLPKGKNEVLIGLKDEWYQGIFKNIPTGKPDVIYFDELLPSIIDIKNILNIQFPEDVVSIQSFVNERKDNSPVLAFSFFPIPKNDWVKAVKDQLFFPPKSTRFMPILRSGLTMFDFKNDTPLTKN